MSTPMGTRGALALLIGLLTTVASATAPVMASAATPPVNALLPNLQMAPLSEWTIERRDGRRLLRFTTIFVNLGPGPFELHGSRPDTASPVMTMDQIVFPSRGPARRLPAVAFGRYAGDGHEHWHTGEVTVLEMWLESNPSQVWRGAKIDFCFFDNDRTAPDVAGARERPHYRFHWCGEPEALQTRVGVSVGWGDRYGWDFVNQWIDITGLPGGTYRVRATVDQQNRFAESNDADNCAWSLIRIPSASRGGAVTVEADGTNCGVGSALPVRTFPGAEAWDPPRGLQLAAGVHVGYLLNDVGSVLRERRFGLLRPLTVSVVRRAHPIGQAGDLYYVASGLWAGHWIPAGPGATLVGS